MMKKIFSIVMLLVLLNIVNIKQYGILALGNDETVKTIEQETFLLTAEENYDAYNIYENSSYDNNYDIMVIIGMLDNDYYLSAFLYSNAQQIFDLNIVIGDNLKTARMTNRVASFHKILVEEERVYQITTGRPNSIIMTQQIDLDLNMVMAIPTSDFLVGLGNDTFPKNNFLASPLVIISIVMIIASVFAVSMVIAAFVVLKRKYKKHLAYLTTDMDIKSKMPFPFIYEKSIEEVTPEIRPFQVYHQPRPQAVPQPTFKTDDGKTKKQIEEELYTKRRLGIISESQFNSALRNLWLSDEDEEN